MLDELLALVFFVLAGAGVGAMLSALLPGLLVGACIWAALQWVRLLRLRRWLDADAPADAPGVGGLWGDVYRRIAGLGQGRDESEERRRYSRLEDGVATLPYGFLIITRDRCIEWFNAAISDFLHLSYPDDLDLEIDHLVRHPDFVAALESDEDVVEMSLNLFDRALAVYISSFGAAGYRLIVVQDLSRVHYLERARSELLGNVTHELKTPLTVISGYAEMIAGAAESAPDGRAADAATQISRQAGHMNRIIEDLLMLERLEGSRPPAYNGEKVSVRRLADEVVEEVAVINPESRCRIDVAIEKGVVLHGSRSELHSVLSNLVGNAVRYSPAGGVVRVVWSQDGNGRHLSVSDQGPGIDPVHLPRLTERFYRVDKSRSRESGGTGLGLAIVKHVLQRYGASLRIESEPGRGSVFHCDFPAAP